MRPTATGRPRDERIDEAIVTATRELLVEVGYIRLTMAMIADRAGTNRPSLYRRWPTKAHLVHDAVFPSDLPAPDPAGSFAEDLRRRIGRLAASYARPEAREAVLGLMVDLRTPAERAGVLESLQSSARSDFRAWMEQAVLDGELRADVDPDVVLDTIVGTLHLRIVAQQGDPARVVPELVDLLLRGLAP
jgi:AcrR family transcriptional regulator